MDSESAIKVLAHTLRRHGVRGFTINKGNVFLFNNKMNDEEHYWLEYGRYIIDYKIGEFYPTLAHKTPFITENLALLIGLSYIPRERIDADKEHIISEQSFNLLLDLYEHTKNVGKALS